MNQVGLVGRLVRTPELHEIENKRKMTRVTLALTRSFKNVNGEYETDFIDVLLWDNMAVNTVNFCKRGDIISIRGRLQSRIIDKNGEKRYVIEVIAEKVTFISNARKTNPESLENETLIDDEK